MSVVSKFMANPGYKHWKAVQWILRHLKGTMKCGMVYNGSNDRIPILLGILIKKKDLKQVICSLWEAVL